MGNIRRYWFTGDTHFSHKNVIKYCNRPFETAAEMNEKLIENWNKVVTKSDIVYHVGDVAFEKDQDKLDKLLSKLHGEKHLVWGNHDKGLKGSKLLRHFHSLSDIKTLVVPVTKGEIVSHQRIVLCHYAMRVWDQAHYGTWHLFGHSHSTLPDDPNSLSCDVGVDAWNYAPVSFEQLQEVMAKKTFKPIDGHRGKNTNDDVFPTD